MKSSKSILVGIILVMVTVFATHVFAQITPTQPSTQPPILRKSDPNQKLRELQAAEDRKRVSRQQALRSEVNKLVQKDIEMAKTKKKAEICTSPKIFYVSSREVYPGDPFYIRGCGFGITKGMVAILPLNRQLEIETWVEGRIVGKIPSDITGFADPKTITLKVVTIQGNASDPSPSLTLKPNIEIKQLMTTQWKESTCPPAAADTYPQFCKYLDIRHVNVGQQQCQGVDTLFQPLQLKNNWVFHYFNMEVSCCKYPRFGGPEHFTSCSDTGGQASPVQNMNLLIGKSTIPKIEINWSTGAGDMWWEVRLSYSFQMFIYGPAGTSHQ